MRDRMTAGCSGEFSSVTAVSSMGGEENEPEIREMIHFHADTVASRGMNREGADRRQLGISRRQALWIWPSI